MDKKICEKKMLCTGCTACISVCPERCIMMEANEEGFLYPKIEESLCVNCGLCNAICPVNHPPKKYLVKKGYVSRHKNLEIVKNSTSGGFCTAVANYVFQQDGVLFGAGYDQNIQVRHFFLEKVESNRAFEMRGSKYVQSDLSGIFGQVQAFLSKGRYVGFIGTPCQVAGLKAFLKDEPKNLLTVDVVCHGVASPLVFQKYLEYISQNNNARPVDVRFRNKTYGYHSGTMRIEFENGKVYCGSGRVDYMLKAYFDGVCSRYSCYKCPFKGMERYGDFTGFDCWHIEKLLLDCKDDDQGYNNIFVNTEKGERILNEMEDWLNLWEADPVMMKKLDGNMIEGNACMAACREYFIETINQIGFEKAMKKYLPISRKDRMIEKSKSILYKTHLIHLFNRE